MVESSYRMKMNPPAATLPSPDPLNGMMGPAARYAVCFAHSIATPPTYPTNLVKYPHPRTFFGYVRT